MTPLKRVLRLAKPHQKYLFLSIFFNILYSVLNIFSVGTMLPILGLMFGTIEKVNTDSKPTYSGHLGELFSYLKNLAYYKIQINIDYYGVTNVLAALCLITALAFFIRNLFRYLGSFLLVNYRIGITQDLRTMMYEKFLKLPVSFFTEQKKGDLLSRISNDVGAVENSIMNTIPDLINAPFMIIGSLATLFLMEAKLTLFSLIVFPIMGWLISYIGKSLKKQAHFAQIELGNLFSLIDETLKSSKIIKIFNADKILNEKFKSISNNWQFHSISMSRKREMASPMSEFLGSVTLLLITWFAGVQIVETKSMAPETFLVFIGMFFQILDPAKKLASAISSIQGGTASLERVMEVLDYDLDMENKQNSIPVSEIKHEIEFKNISFQYSENHTILHNFSMKLEKGKTIALVGQSGSGKTTVANLLARFYDTHSGNIYLDGIDIKTLNLKNYRNLIGMVTQESVLFNDTIYNNILMGKPNASEEEIYQAAKIANAHQFIENLPDGYHTNIGDDGNKLSGGQKQRISIARAVLKNPPIMILDEATSALDTESEKFVQDALEKMMENRTSLVIAHRLSTIQKADHIIVMEKGEIIEQGTHDDLLSKNRVYKKLVELQNFK